MSRAMPLIPLCVFVAYSRVIFTLSYLDGYYKSSSFWEEFGSLEQCFQWYVIDIWCFKVIGLSSM